MAASGGVLVTGASTGIGAATVRLLAARGYQVFGTVRRARDTAPVEAAGAMPLMLDVTYPPGIARARDTVERALAGAPLRGVVNNAGIPAVGALEHIGLDEVRRVFEVNVLGALAVTQAFLPLLRASGGRVINISSVSARMALPFAGPYAASKSALEALSDSLRRELLPTGVDVIVIQPGSVRTPIWRKIAATDTTRYAGTAYEQGITRLKHLAERSGARGLSPETVARAVLRALAARRPAARILLVKRGWLAQKLARVLPHRFLDRLVRRRVWGRSPAGQGPTGSVGEGEGETTPGSVA